MRLDGSLAHRSLLASPLGGTKLKNWKKAKIVNLSIKSRQVDPSPPAASPPPPPPPPPTPPPSPRTAPPPSSPARAPPAPAPSPPTPRPPPPTPPAPFPPPAATSFPHLPPPAADAPAPSLRWVPMANATARRGSSGRPRTMRAPSRRSGATRVGTSLLLSRSSCPSLPASQSNYWLPPS
jgi:hypothetical protein